MAANNNNDETCCNKDKEDIDKLTVQLEVLDLQKNTEKMTSSRSNQRTNSCPICQDTIVHPISLPCGHRFCYLCLKGVFARNGTCPMCRNPIPPQLVAKPDSVHDEDKTELNDVHWMYEAKNGGWWLYEKRLSNEIEKVFVAKKPQTEVQISGFSYVIDFEQMVQYRTDKPDRRRSIKRETADNRQYKGVAGIPMNSGIDLTVDRK